MSQNNDVLIIGGGIIGVSTAYFLSQQGLKVTLIEKEEICAGSSYGNAGLLCPCHSMPIPKPGVLSQGLKWLLDPESPFYIKPRLDLALFNWLWHFQAHCNETALQSAIPLLRDMQRSSLDVYKDLIEKEDIACHFQPVGGLSLFNTESGFIQAQREVQEMSGFGLAMELLDGDAVRTMEPAVQPDVIGGIHYQEDAHLSPAMFVNGLARVAEAQGVTVLTQTEVLDFTIKRQAVTAVHTSQGLFQPQQVVLAAGAWSANIARKLRVDIPLQAAKGYSITFKQPTKLLRMHLHLSEAKVAVTPMGDHLRFAGTLELAGINTSINKRRVNAILKAGDAYLLGMDTHDEAEIWAGLRPCSPDGLPYLGRSSTLDNLVVATGHAMLGMSMGPVSGKLVSQIVCNQELDLDIRGFSVDRFN